MKSPHESKLESLRDLWMGEVVRKLEAEAIAAIRPAIKAAAQAAVAELEPVLREHYNYGARELGLYLCVQDKDGLMQKVEK